MEIENKQSILQQAINGDAEAFSHIVGEYYDMIFRVAYKWCGDKNNAEDIAQEVCIKLAKAIKKFRGDSKLSSWIYRITLNTAKDLHKKQKNNTELNDEHASSYENAEEQLINQDLWSKVKKLPTKECDAVLLVYAEGLNHREVAEIMKCKESTVSWYIHEAKKKLQVILGGGK